MYAHSSSKIPPPSRSQWGQVDVKYQNVWNAKITFVAPRPRHGTKGVVNISASGLANCWGVADKRIPGVNIPNSRSPVVAG